MIRRKKEEVEAVSHGLDYLKYKEKREMPLIWLLIDELHEFLPEQGKTPATDALIQVLREGRQPGISLAGATQQPGKVHSDVWTQSDIVIAHRLTAKPDVQALSTIMQSYLDEDILNYMNQLLDYAVKTGQMSQQDAQFYAELVSKENIAGADRESAYERALLSQPGKKESDVFDYLDTGLNIAEKLYGRGSGKGLLTKG